MKKYLSMLAFVAGSFMIASCSGSEAEEEIKNDSKIMTIKVSAPTTAVGSRAKIEDINASSLFVKWENNDEVSIFGDADHSNHKFRYSEAGSGANIAVFKGPDFESTNCFVLYPHQDDATFDGTKIHATIPSVQKATKNTFDPKAAICGEKGTKAAFETSGGISLKHACAFLQITTEEDCEYINVSVDSDWYFTGGIDISESSSGVAVTINSSTGGKKYAKLTADGTEECTKTFPAGTYLIAIASSTSFPQFKVTVQYKNKAAITSTSSSSSNNFSSAYVYNLGTASKTSN